MQSGAVSHFSRSFSRLNASTGYSNSLRLTPCGGTQPAVTGLIPNFSLEASLLGGVRFRFTKKPNLKETARHAKEGEGIKYEGFTFYPRFPDHKDPPIEPSKLFLVKRIRGLAGCPYWEKQWMFRLQLHYRGNSTIVKNTPSVNKLLYRVKHLVEITPITLPQGMPDKPENGFLKENGEFINYNLLGAHGEIELEEAEKLEEERLKKHIDKETIKFRLHQRWYSRYDVV